MNDDVLDIDVSPDAKYIATALLDCTVKKDIILMFGVLRSAAVLILLSQDLMTDLYVVGIVQKSHFSLSGVLKMQEEKEKRLEEMFESDLDNAIENRYAPKEELPEEGAVALAGKKTQETLTATDLIIEALDVVEEELDRIAQHEEEKTRGNVAEFQPDIRMLGLSPSDYVLRTLSNVNTNDLEQTLLALPFADALKLLSYLKDWASNPDKEKMIRAVRRNTSRGK
ncbi:WD repeat-containing protein 3 homolog isoform X2 [Pistacia vera]|uniref:WD repeat-containing protein 3 homolog isoform X2 n=2 Tax=Pistacia vera TaxID=55513 RepID=UPI001262E09C|nr:WD repeat-containing protein 3 homolog isoform X2 [Pistacia vera]XP_031265941.1 WD repeat-containing protein 3 homolog isoform X2 [Pistacia vera]